MLSPQSVWRRYERWWDGRRGADRITAILVLLSTIFGAALRLANFRPGLQYLADQGRDAIVAYGILHGNLALVGPSTSVGDMFLGPLYYYFMAPFLWLSGFDPIGPALAVAALGILTIPLLYFVGRRLVGRGSALIAVILYAAAPVVIEYSRFSWNPNPAPFVALLLIYCVWRAWRGSAWWWLGAAASFAAIIQLHYVALLAAAPAGIYWLADIVRTIRTRPTRRRSLIISSLGCVAVLFGSFTPLILFNWKFNNIIGKGFIDFFNGDQQSGEPPLLVTLGRDLRETQGRALQALFELWGKEWSKFYRQINLTLLGGYVAVLILGIRTFWRSRYRDGYLMVLISLVATVAGLATYKSSVYFHYISFFFPLSYLITGIVIVLLVRWIRLVGIVLGMVLLAYIFWLAFQPAQTYYLRPGGGQVDDVKRVAEQVFQELPPGKTYALTELSDVRDYRGLVYRYFLIQSTHPPVELENFADADYLVVIADNPREPNQVLGSPVYEIAAFPKGDYRIIKNDRGPWLYFIARQPAVIK